MDYYGMGSEGCHDDMKTRKEERERGGWLGVRRKRKREE